MPEAARQHRACGRRGLPGPPGRSGCRLSWSNAVVMSRLPSLLDRQQNGLAMQAAGVGVGVDGRGLVERAAGGDVDAQLTRVDTADQPGQLRGVASDEDPLRADLTA